ncbi:hypothetical protein OESDEN_20117 [Oesophagostomum dentatum]|uniref:Uncharacterized protein n=1 Tax=Oesophagostomum dentatum TaxID=61180 RepID=A0A0B1S8K3_OESDE|nr:hypothetical protein OESDEN_20117 [Oesophagostomum dentatum]
MLTMARAVICQRAVPQNRMQAFSLTRIHQCISSCVVLFLSPYLPVTRWTIVLTVSMITGVSTFVVVVRRTNKSIYTLSPADQMDEKESEKATKISVANGQCLNE